MRHLGYCTPILMLLVGLGRADAAVTLSYAYDYAGVADCATSVCVCQYSGGLTAMPHDATSAACLQTGHAITDLTRTQSSFDYAFDHLRPDTPGSYAYSSGGIGFTVDQDTPYTLAGCYELTGVQGVSLSCGLWDYTTGYLFYGSQSSFTTADASLTLGSSAHSEQYVSTGSLAGMLEAGHSYRFSYAAEIETYARGNAPASAQGDVVLTLGVLAPESPVVPEPTTFAIWSLLGGVGMVARWRRRV
jgi:hypothetical protein